MKTQTFCKIFPFLFVLISVVGYAQENPETWMPDPNLRSAVREELGIPNRIPLIQLHMRELVGLDIEDKQITNLTGLEHAKNLKSFSCQVNSISDISPLSILTHLEGLYLGGNEISDIAPLAGLINLGALHLWQNHIVDISPLANLVKLKDLLLEGNQIVDISPLANLTNLKNLGLHVNRIVDIRPLKKLTLLEKLQIQNNPITDYSPLDALSLTHFEYDDFCVFPGRPIQERLQNRNFPSVVNAWNDILNRPTLSYEAQLAHHDLIWSPEFGLRFQKTNDGLQLAGNLNDARKRREALLEMNPNMIFILDLPMQAADPNSPFYKAMYDDNFPWIRDEAGNIVPMSDEVDEYEYPSFLIDFTHPDGQDIIVQQAIAVSQCGLYDGIFFDLWSEDWYILEGHRTYEAEQRARTIILQRIRAEVGDDFLILVNPNRHKPMRAAPYINGLFMETVRDYEGGYTYAGLREIEDTLLWAEEHLQSPRVNCLEGWGVKTQVPDSPTNLRWMRAFTTMSLTHSDGYVLYITGIRHPIHEHDWRVFEITHKEKHDQGIEHNHHHDHYWYDFYDADLGQPIGEKAQLYRNQKGIFIREFTNGWAVYNRSGKSRNIQLPEKVSGVASRVENKRWHIIPDLDGEIYLKALPTSDPKGADTVEVIPAWDVNEDGSINKTDLLLVAENIGVDPSTLPRADVNRDGRITVADLQLVIDNLDDPTTATAPILAGDVSMVFNPKLLYSELNHVGTDAQAFSAAIALLQRLLANIHPQKTQLLANYPNPFNPETWLPYQLANDAEVTIRIYSSTGQLVRHLDLGFQQAGYYIGKARAAYWDGRNDLNERLASGVYFFQLSADDFTATRKMLILK